MIAKIKHHLVKSFVDLVWLLIYFDTTKGFFWQIILFIILADHPFCHFAGGGGGGADLVLVPGPGWALNGPDCKIKNNVPRNE